VLGVRGVQRAGFANRPVVVANDLDDIIRAIALYSEADENSRPGGVP
jgi:threonine synthase